MEWIKVSRETPRQGRLVLALHISGNIKLIEWDEDSSILYYMWLAIPVPPNK